MKYIKKYENFDLGEEESKYNIIYYIRKNDLKSVRKLLKRNIEIDKKYGECEDTALTCAIFYQGSFAIIKELIKYGADINLGDNTDVTPLMCAIIQNRPTIFDYLLHLDGIDINKISKEFESALIITAQFDKAKMAEKLIEAGADIQYKDDEDRDFYDIAKQFESNHIINMVEKKYPEFIAVKKYNL